MGGNALVLAVATVARTKQKHGRQRNPPSHGMDDDGTGKVVEFLAKGSLQPGMDAKGLVPGDAFKEWINEADEQESGDQLRMKSGPFGNTAGNDGRNGGSEGEQEEELGQLVTVPFHQRVYAGKEMGTVGNAVADEEIGDGRYPEIAQDLDQGIYLVFFANGAEFEKGKTCVHGQHHDGAEQNEQHLATGLIRFHETPKRNIGSLEASTIPVH